MYDTRLCCWFVPGSICCCCAGVSRTGIRCCTLSNPELPIVNLLPLLSFRMWAGMFAVVAFRNLYLYLVNNVKTWVLNTNDWEVNTSRKVCVQERMNRTHLCEAAWLHWKAINKSACALYMKSICCMKTTKQTHEKTSGRFLKWLFNEAFSGNFKKNYCCNRKTTTYSHVQIQVSTNHPWISEPSINYENIFFTSIVPVCIWSNTIARELHLYKTKAICSCIWRPCKGQRVVLLGALLCVNFWQYVQCGYTS